MTPELSGMHVLIVDDNPDNQLLIAKFLELANAQVQVASSGEEAFEIASGRPFDAILMDIQMPDMDGYEATRKLRASGYEKPILALSAHAMNHERELVLAAGCNDHVAKPVDRKTLVSTLLKYYSSRQGTAAPDTEANAPFKQA